MIEFGSEFHYIQQKGVVGASLMDYYPEAVYYADGRQALIHLYKSQGWKRLWMPEYYCYDVVEFLKQSGLELVFYRDFPGCGEDNNTLEALERKGSFRDGDAILRVNYFGTRSVRRSDNLSVASIVEDHTHDLIGGWAAQSTAGWCIASLRKTLPIPEGGILWSPSGLQLPDPPSSSEQNEEIAGTRWEAMKLKERYLAGDAIAKAAFRAGYVDTEVFFDTAPVCALDVRSKEYLRAFDIRAWYQKKRENWAIMSAAKMSVAHVLCPENLACNPFSLVLLFDSVYDRDKARKELIGHDVYPAVLWDLPATVQRESSGISRRMLSIHCDGRYDAEDLQQLKLVLESVTRR